MSSDSGLDVDTLLERAQRETGLGDFGDDTVPDRVATVLDSIDEGGDLDAAGRKA
ncbi:MAG: hypothetical protein JO214_04515, partial [Frankiaceae bacterium]|nr:hypothetical protein [Frankiaceae bacterium]